MEDEIILNKFDSMKKCLHSARTFYLSSPETFLSDYMQQDAVVKNIERAAQVAIDVATHIVRIKKLDLPKEAKDVFSSLRKNHIISKTIEEEMKNMVGFRNIAIHEYQKLDMNIVVSVVTKHLADFEEFMKEILKAS